LKEQARRLYTFLCCLDLARGLNSATDVETAFKDDSSAEALAR
jgi:hypothetical protein